MSKKDNLLGKKFGRLTVIGNGMYRKGATRWDCICDCGVKVSVRAYDLKSGKQKSCGCGKNERIVKYSTKHGMCGTKLYKTWCNMKSRCNNPLKKDYKWYGGKGIKVCQEWAESFEKFEEWATSTGYSDNLTIDRIDSQKDYQPENCRWIPLAENVLRACKQTLFTVDGETHNASQWDRLIRKYPGCVTRWNNTYGKEEAEKRIEAAIKQIVRE